MSQEPTNASKFFRQPSHTTVVLILTALLFLFGSLVVQGFASLGNIRAVLIQAAILGIVAAGQTVVIITAGIDLSVPWLMTTSAILTTTLSGGEDRSLIWVIPTVLGFAAGVGLFNGMGVALLDVPPIIMTLATNVMLNGFIVLFVGIAPPSRAPDFVRSVATGYVLGIPTSFLVLAVSTVFMGLLLNRTRFGRHLYAVGTSATVSRFSGVQPTPVLLRAYVFSGIATCLAGLLFLGFTGTAYAGMGNRYLFTSISAVIVGGASILGGKGNYRGTLAGALLLTIVTVLLTVFSLGAGVMNALYGSIILINVWLASSRVGR
jgi:ribose transport system permease protein